MFDVFYFGKKPNLFPHEQQVASLEEAQVMSRTRMFWIVNYLCDYRDFDFLWEPTPWESHQRHVWSSQWQSDSGTWLVPKNGFTETNYGNKSTVKRRPLDDIVLIDHGNQEEFLGPEPIRRFRYVEDYLSTLKRIANSIDAEYVWVCSSICEYQSFDFSWHPNAWQTELLHVFASNSQQQGDTFFMHVPSAREKLNSIEILDWYDLNYVNKVFVHRLWPPINNHSCDTQVEAVKNHVFTWPYEVFTDDPNFDELPVISLWRRPYKNIVSMSKGGSTVLVPREAQTEIKTQLYDYPFIVKQPTHTDFLLPIVFVSNGEECADENYEILKSRLRKWHRLMRIDGVKGRVQSQHHVANAVNRPWYYFVPAKLRVAEDFEFSWQPDRLQAPKHYVFHAHNPVTGLTYGHMAMVCYNKKLVLETQGTGLDFTLEQPHAIVPIVSGTATYNCDPKTAWRTAFRETVKLKHYQCVNPDIETDYRLERWLEGADGVNGIYSQLGAQAGVDYYQSVQGDFAALKKTYDWKFLDHLWEETSPHFSLK